MFHDRNSVGTEAYIAYVEQFEAWERDVDRRREMIRSKTESEASESQVRTGVIFFDHNSLIHTVFSFASISIYDKLVFLRVQPFWLGLFHSPF